MSDSETPESIYNCPISSSNYYDLQNFTDLRCIKGGVYVGIGLFAIGLVLLIVMCIVRNILRCRGDVSKSNKVITSTLNIINLETISSNEQSQSSIEVDNEEQPYFKRVVYQSKYKIKKPRDHTKRKKKSFFRSFRLRSSDSSDYENADLEEDIDYVNVGKKKDQSEFKKTKKSDKDEDDDDDYENV